MKINKPLNKTDLKKIPDLEEKILDLQDKLTRSIADYINLEKRIESQRQLITAMATISIVGKIVDVLDDLNLAQSHLKDTGLQMTVDKLKQVLKSEGLTEINPEDKEFDPSTMECTQVADGKDGFVVSVNKVGYSINDQVIRPAQVVVGKKAEDIN